MTARMAWPAAAVLAVALVATGCRRDSGPAGQARPDAAGAAGRRTARYQCPMHPTYVSDKPGNCPICGMKLVPIAAAGAPAGPRRIAYYRSPMDPSVRSDKPVKDSMGMDFVPVYEDELEAGGAVPGRAAVTLSGERRQMLGVRSEEVTVRRLERAIRTVGRVAADERRIHHVHTKFEGYVEHLYVDFTGKYVRRGQPLLSLFSPELVATQQEYLLAYRAQKRLGASGIPSVAQGGVDLLEAARQRLLLWDIRPQDIDRLEAAGQVRRTLDLHAELSGYVVQKSVFHGMRVMPQDTLFDIADLSRLWVLADVYETDLPAVRLGMVGQVKVTYLPGKTWRGPVTYIAPTVEEQTRTVKVRIEIENRGEELKPGMFADVFLESDLGSGLVVPEGAVIDTGGRRLVFLDRGEGRYEPREVQLGPKVAEGFQVLGGLEAGERVVTSANFLLDSESSLKAAVSAMGSPTPAGSPGLPPGSHRH